MYIIIAVNSGKKDVKITVRNFDFYDYRVFISTGLELKKSKSNKTNINNTNFNNIYLILSERKNSILDRI